MCVGGGAWDLWVGLCVGGTKGCPGLSLQGFFTAPSTAQHLCPGRGPSAQAWAREGRRHSRSARSPSAGARPRSDGQVTGPPWLQKRIPAPVVRQPLAGGRGMRGGCGSVSAAAAGRREAGGAPPRSPLCRDRWCVGVEAPSNMALSRKSMVDSVYTVWNTCPSSEHSSSAAACRGTVAPSWAAPGGQPAPQPFPPRPCQPPHRPAWGGAGAALPAQVPCTHTPTPTRLQRKQDRTRVSGGTVAGSPPSRVREWDRGEGPRG